mgnify:CR=1 FL=1
MAGNSESKDIKLTRIYDAPLKSVWDAWSDPKELEGWWGPRGFSITNQAKELRLGGQWRFIMHGPNKVDYPNVITYVEVTPGKRLVYDHGSPEAPEPAFRTTVDFTTQDHGKTRMDLTMTLPSIEAANATRKIIKEMGGETTWDRLGEFLAAKLSGREQFMINRSFEVSLPKMFEVWTDPKHLSTWLAPVGATINFLRADIRQGGGNFYVMTMQNGGKMYGKSSYIAIDPPSFLEYTQQFCDEHERAVRHPMSPTWPLIMKTAVNFSSESEGRTRICLIWEPYGQTPPEEIATFVSGRAGMTQGWTGSFDKLAAYLQTRPT